MNSTMVAGLAFAASGSCALAGLANSNATVMPTGIRAGANGRAFMNIEAASNGSFATFAVARFDLSADKAELDAQYPGGWTVAGATLVLTESNAAFSAPLDVAVFYSADDTTIILNDGSNPTLHYDPTVSPGGNNLNVNSDGTGIVRDADPLGTWMFNETGHVGDGTVQTVPLALTPSLLAKVGPGSAPATVTLVFEALDAIGSATYAGYANTTFAGPTLTIVARPISTCGSADFNCDGDVGTDADIEAFFACIAGTCPDAPCTSTADFNGDGDIGTDADIEAFFRVLGGGNC